MARKISVKLILELRVAHLSMRKIAQTWHISRHSVSDVFRIAEDRGIAYRDVQSFGDDEAYRLIFPDNLKTGIVPNRKHENPIQTGLTRNSLTTIIRQSC